LLSFVALDAFFFFAGFDVFEVIDLLLSYGDFNCYVDGFFF